VKSGQKISVILIVLLLLINFLLTLNLSHFRRETYDSLNGLKRNVNDIMGSLSNAIGRIRYEINEANSWLIESIIKIDEEKSVDGKVFVNFHWTFSEMDKDSEVYMLYRIKDQEWNWHYIIQDRGLNYTSVLELDPTREYEYQVIAESGKIKSTEIMSIPPELYSYQRFNVEVIRAYSEDMVTVNEITVNVKPQFEPVLDWLSISEVKLLVRDNDKLVDSILFTEKQYIIDESQKTEDEKVANVPEDKLADEQKVLEASYAIPENMRFEFFIEYIYNDGHISREKVDY